jgi:hypothetical protein
MVKVSKNANRDPLIMSIGRTYIGPMLNEKSLRTGGPGAVGGYNFRRG